MKLSENQALAIVVGPIYLCGINSEEEEKNVDAVKATEKRPTWDANFVKKACR